MPRVGKWLVPQATLMLLLAISSVQAPSPSLGRRSTSSVQATKPSQSRRATSRRPNKVIHANGDLTKFWSFDKSLEVYTIRPTIVRGSLDYDLFWFFPMEKQGSTFLHRLKLPTESETFRDKIYCLNMSSAAEDDELRGYRFMEYIDREKGFPKFSSGPFKCVGSGCIIKMFTDFKENDAFEVLTNNTLVHSSPEMLKRRGVANTILAKDNTYWMSTTPLTMHKVPHYQVLPYSAYHEDTTPKTSLRYLKTDVNCWDFEPEGQGKEQWVKLHRCSGANHVATYYKRLIENVNAVARAEFEQFGLVLETLNGDLIPDARIERVLN
eukprot:Lankesteria_metandrocarpae@DN5410_c0_g2_i1.p1